MTGITEADWEVIALALGGACVALLGIIWGRVSADLANVANRLSDVAQIVHGHNIRLDRLEVDRDER